MIVEKIKKTLMQSLNVSKSGSVNNANIHQLKALSAYKQDNRNDFVRQAKTQELMDLNSGSAVQMMSVDSLKENASQFFGHDFSDVNIVQQSKDAEGMGALAYAQGRDVHFAPGIAPLQRLTKQDAMIAGHEFAHVVQQAEGRVPVTGTIQGKPLNDNRGLESEADQAGAGFASFLGL